MALVFADRVQETTTTAGTGTITLAGAVAGFQSFSAIGNANTTYYTIINGSNWETGVGTYTSAGTTLSRDTVLSSSNSGNKITLSGTSNVFVSPPSSRTVLRDASNILALPAGTTTVPPLDFTAGTNLTSALAGAMEYDGKVLYFTPQGAQRGVVPGMQIYVFNSTYALSSTTTASQAWVNGLSCTLSSNTTYLFKAFIPFIRTGTGTVTVSHGFGGTATLTNIEYLLLRYYDTGGFTSVNSISGLAGLSFFTTAANSTTMTGSTASTTYQWLKMEGQVTVNAGGTFTPTLTNSATGTTNTIQIGAYFMIYPVGSGGASNVSVGTWA
jgi:hypothetical protein